MEKSNLKKLKIGDSKVNRFCIGNNSKKIVKKLKKSKGQKLSKLRKSKSEKLAKSKKLFKKKNSPNFDAMKAKSSFLTFNIRTAFHCLWLAFIKALIL